VQPAGESGDLARLLVGFGCERERGACELLAQVAVGEAVQRVLAREQDLEEGASWGESGLKGRTVLPFAVVAARVMASSSRMAGVGSSTRARAAR